MKKHGGAETGNGAQYLEGLMRSRKILILCVTVLIIALAVCIIVFHWLYVRNTDEIDAVTREKTTALEQAQKVQSLNGILTEENDSLYKENAELNENIKALEAELDRLENEIAQSDLEKDELQKQYDELKAAYDELADQ